MSTWLWAVLVIAVVIVAVLILVTAIRNRRSERLREGFGPEYDRAIDRAGDRGAGEAELRDRQARHDELELRPLAPLARKRFMDAWQGTQAEFVDDPAVAISDADRLIQSVMLDRGYPIEDFDDRAALVSVDHPRVVERYRRAHTIAIANAGGDTDTEQLRIAMQDYRALFEELVGDTVDA
jgi:hypothetical protein